MFRFVKYSGFKGNFFFVLEKINLKKPKNLLQKEFS